MSEFCVINDAQELLSNLRDLINNLDHLPSERRKDEFKSILLDIGGVINSAEHYAEEWDTEIKTLKDEVEKAEEKISELEEERDALREQLLEITDWRGVLANDPDPYDLHGLHHGDDTGHSWYARFWQKLRSTFTN